MKKTNIEKEAIIAEYLTGQTSYRKLGEKYGIESTKCKLNNGLLRYLTGLFLASCSSALPASASSGETNVKLYSGLNKMCKLASGLLTKKCKLFSGRDTLLNSKRQQNWATHSRH